MVLFSALNSISNPVLYYLTSGVVIISGLVVLLLLQVIGFRLYSVYKKKDIDKAKKIWRPILAEIMLSYPDNIPNLQKKHQHVFLREWNRFHSMVRGDAHIRLQVLARHKRLDMIAHRYIKSSNIRKQLQGIVTLGHIQDYSIWNELIDFTQLDHAILSMTAAQALVDIDSKNAITFLMPHIIKRRDWPVARVAAMMQSASSEDLAMMLEQAIDNAPVEDIAYILGFLGSRHFDPKIRVLCDRLGNSEDSRILSACINAAKDAQGLQLARKHASNPLWYIRLHVARAIGRLGTKEDIKILVNLMSDPEWWVRYRSAQAIVQMPFINAGDLDELQRQLEDRYARDILQQAITEQQWA